MNPGERFDAIMSYRKPDRMPVWFFGYWAETLELWNTSGLNGRQADEYFGMDTDWENGMWNWHGICRIEAHGDQSLCRIIEETDSYVIEQDCLGGIARRLKDSESIKECIKPPVEPNRESWNSFRKLLDADDPWRFPDGWQERARKVQAQPRVKTMMGGSLFGYPRNWFGLEAWSLLAYDDPALYEEIIAWQAEYFMKMAERVLPFFKPDFVYLFEDCCGSNGPLYSPAAHRQFYHKYYVRMVEFYKSRGVKYVLLDSDGKVDPLIPCWLDAGVDIIFPIEIGTWNADPMELRRRFGRSLRMMGGFDKHLIRQGRETVRRELTRLLPLVEEGGFIPMPDHRIPPDVSIAQFRDYLEVFQSVYGYVQ